MRQSFSFNFCCNIPVQRIFSLYRSFVPGIKPYVLESPKHKIRLTILFSPFDAAVRVPLPFAGCSPSQNKNHHHEECRCAEKRKCVSHSIRKTAHHGTGNLPNRAKGVKQSHQFPYRQICFVCCEQRLVKREI